MISLIPEINLQLEIDDPDIPSSAYEAFAEIFRKTWSQVPGVARDEIIRYWRTAEYPVSIDLTPEPEPSEYQLFLRGLLFKVWGGTWSSGCMLLFNCALTNYPEFMTAVIAHELVHVFQIATDVIGPEAYLESNAITTALDWGFVGIQDFRDVEAAIIESGQSDNDCKNS